MHWMLTVSADADPLDLGEQLAAFGATLDPVAPVPLGRREKVVFVTGPADLATRLADAGLPVKVSPSSDFGTF